MRAWAGEGGTARGSHWEVQGVPLARRGKRRAWRSEHTRGAVGEAEQTRRGEDRSQEYGHGGEEDVGEDVEEEEEVGHAACAHLPLLGARRSQHGFDGITKAGSMKHVDLKP